MSAAEWPILRQTPHSTGIWGNCQFFVGAETGEYDYWVVYDGLARVEKACCPPEHTILITGEPPAVRQYDRNFVRQFGAVMTCHRDIDHPHIIYTQQSQPWHVGRRVVAEQNISFSKNYDELMSTQVPAKTKLLSVISSNKTLTVGHVKRVEFIDHLTRRFGNQLEVFGRGVRDVEDKWDAIAPYKYHIVLENSSYEDYWTEKLSDAYLANALPIYYGCWNLTNYFAPESFVAININRPDEAMATIERCIREETYERRSDSIQKAKLDVLNKYNLFAVIASLAEQGERKQKQIVTLIPETQRHSMGLLRRLKAALY